MTRPPGISCANEEVVRHATADHASRRRSGRQEFFTAPSPLTRFCPMTCSTHPALSVRPTAVLRGSRRTGSRSNYDYDRMMASAPQEGPSDPPGLSSASRRRRRPIERMRLGHAASASRRVRWTDVRWRCMSFHPLLLGSAPGPDVGGAIRCYELPTNKAVPVVLPMGSSLSQPTQPCPRVSCLIDGVRFIPARCADRVATRCEGQRQRLSQGRWISGTTSDLVRRPAMNPPGRT